MNCRITVKSEKTERSLQPLGILQLLVFSSQRALYRIVVFAEANNDRCHHVPFSDSGSEKRLIEKHRASAAVGHPEMVHSAVNMDHLGKYDRTVAVFMHLLKDRSLDKRIETIPLPSYLA